MSSGTPSATSSSATSSSSQTGTGSTGMQLNLNANSSLPFSFLVTFIAIFLFFLGCGLGSRRFTRQLRRNLALQITPAETPSNSRTSEKPILWDTYAYDLPFAVSLKGRADRAADRYAWERMSVSTRKPTKKRWHSLPPNSHCSRCLRPTFARLPQMKVRAQVAVPHRVRRSRLDGMRRL